MPTPTATWITEQSQVDLASLGFIEERLDRLVAVALSTVRRYTDQGWIADVFVPATPLTAADEVLVADAVLKMVEFMAFRAQPDIPETLADFDLISSFSAGSYSESRRSGKDAVEANRAFLRGLLWPLMSPDKQDEWIAVDTGVNAPAFEVTEVDWSGKALGPEGPVGADSWPYPIYEPWPGGRGFWE